MNVFTSLLAGLVFGIGLIVSGMADPAKVLGFLDLAGAWDPSLAFVMAGAILVGVLAFYVAGRRARTFLGGELKLPTARQIDRRLVLGSLTFGVGWGLAGFCPGPAIAALAFSWQAWVFAIGMAAGMALHWIATLPRATSHNPVQADA